MEERSPRELDVMMGTRMRTTLVLLVEDVQMTMKQTDRLLHITISMSCARVRFLLEHGPVACMYRWRRDSFASTIDICARASHTSRETLDEDSP